MRQPFFRIIKKLIFCYITISVFHAYQYVKAVRKDRKENDPMRHPGIPSALS